MKGQGLIECQTLTEFRAVHLRACGATPAHPAVRFSEGSR
jgi:hypothetical protein